MQNISFETFVLRFSKNCMEPPQIKFYLLHNIINILSLIIIKIKYRSSRAHMWWKCKPATLWFLQPKKHTCTFSKHTKILNNRNTSKRRELQFIAMTGNSVTPNCQQFSVLIILVMQFLIDIEWLEHIKTLVQLFQVGTFRTSSFFYKSIKFVSTQVDYSCRPKFIFEDGFQSDFWLIWMWNENHGTNKLEKIV